MTTQETPNTISVSSLQEARLKIYQMQQENTNQRNILKTKFELDGEIFGFNVKQLSEIKKEFTGKATVTMEYTTSDVFKMFKEGMTPLEVLIKTHKPYDEIITIHDQFLELENKIPVQKYFVDKIFSLAREVKPIDGTYDDVLDKIKTAVESHKKFEHFKYPCNDCGKLIRISNGEWPDLYTFMISEKFGHHDCNYYRPS